MRLRICASPFALLFTAALAASSMFGCGDDDTSGPQRGEDTGAQDTGADAATDTSTDATPDVQSDVAVDTTVDTTIDTTIDTTVDTEPDVIVGDLYVSTGDPYVTGPLTVQQVTIAEGTAGAPAGMTVWAPEAAGRYAVVVFQHGFLMTGVYYNDVMTHLASHGFVVVSPQMYPADGNPIGKPTAVEEAALAVSVHTWLTAELSDQIGVTADTSALGLSGHSRGGKVNWLLLSGSSVPADAAQAAFWIDPVDGEGGPLGGEDRAVSGPLPADIPNLFIGTGLGPLSDGGPFSQACAPEGDNHEQFYAQASMPAIQIVATDYGHNDMLDDEPEGCTFICTSCGGGPDRENMRSLVNGMQAGFFRLHLQGDTAMNTVLTDADAAPVAVVIQSR